MIVFELEDLTGKMPVVVFPKVYEQIKESEFFGDDAYFLMVKGKLDYRAGELQFVARQLSKSSIKSMRENAQEQNLYNPNETRFIPVRAVGDEGIDDAHVMEMIGERPPVVSNGELRLVLRDSIELKDLQKIKKVLSEHAGERAVVLNLVVEGRRQDIPTGMGVGQDESVLKVLEPYLEATR